MASFSADEYLKTFLNWESKLHQAAPASFTLDRVEKLLTVFGKPDDKLRFAHVAGTKGKGSTCAFLAEILRASGCRVGLYTSPHLHSLCERIRILEPDVKGKASASCEWQEPLSFPGSIPWHEIEQRLRYYHEDIDRLRASGVEITFYELMTVLAVSYFAARDVQIVVLETGLGGRLDATNVFETSVCGITPIGFDHMNLLGHTLAGIAHEKAGIIRSPLQRVVLAPQQVEALEVLKMRCAEFGIQPELVGRDLPVRIHDLRADGVSFEVEGRRKYRDLFSPLTGRHQAENAALAIGMAEDLETFGFLLTEDAVREGIRCVAWPVRFEKMSSAPAVVLDCAHTAESACALADTFQAVYPGQKAVVVLGMSTDKDHQAVLQALLPLAKMFIFTKADNPRALDFQLQGVSINIPHEFMPTVPAAMQRAKDLAGPEGIVLVTGSVFVSAQARELELP